MNEGDSTRVLLDLGGEDGLSNGGRNMVTCCVFFPHQQTRSSRCPALLMHSLATTHRFKQKNSGKVT